MKTFRKNLFTMGLAVVSAVSLLWSSAFAEGYLGRSTEESENRFEVFGVINNGRQTFNEDGTITRGRMAEILARIQGYSEPHIAPPIEEVYSDVTPEHPDYLWVMIAKNNFWVNGDGEGRFHPDRNVTETEAVKMLLTLAGYGWLAEQCGGYPQGYASAAKMLMLTEETGALTEAPITKDKLLKILNPYLEIYFTGMDDDGFVHVSSADEKTQTTGKMKDGLRLKSKNIADPFN